MAALARVEVLRDGASAMHGTDAIGGGNEQRLNLSGGWGDLEADGMRLWGVTRAAPIRSA